LDVLKEDLFDEDIEVQLEAVRNLQVIVLAMGPSRACTELAAFLNSHCFPTEENGALTCKEEVLKEVAGVLNGSMVEHFGGSASFASACLPLLEKLANAEETVIRESAVQSMRSAAETMDPKIVDTNLVPIMERLAEGEWWTSRFSGAGLAPQLYPLLKGKKSRELALDTLTKLCKDDMPMVRQQCYKFIPKVIKHLPEDRVLTFLTPIMKSLSKELQESIRHSMVDMLRELVGIATTGTIVTLCKAHFSQMVSDENWRVRKRFLSQLMDIAKNAPEKFLNQEVLKGFVARLKDSEPSVRVQAIRLLPEFLPLCKDEAVGKELTKEIVADLVKDEYPEVREAISKSFLYIGPALKHVEVLDILKQFSADEQGDVRLNFCASLGKAAEMVGMDVFKSQLLQIVNKLHNDAKWRVRADIVSSMKQLAQQMGEDDFKRSPVLKMLFDAFKDPVSDVRDAAIEQVAELTKVFGFAWTKKVIMPTMIEVYDEKNKYLHRMVPIKAVRKLVECISKKDEVELLLEIILKACMDSISNVRLLAVQALNDLSSKIEKDQMLKVRPVLEPMLKDKDDDVKFFATVTLQSVAAKEKTYG